MAVFLPELADEDLTAQLDRASGYITSVGGTIKEVLTDSPWGRRRLAYPIRFNSQDFRDGFYAVYHFDLEPSAMVDIERELKLDTRVMRYLVVHDDPKAGERNTGRPAEDVGADNAAVADAPHGEPPAAPTDSMTDEAAADAPSGEAPAAATTVPTDSTTDAAPEELALATSVPASAQVGAEEAAPDAMSAPMESTQATTAGDVAANASPGSVSDMSAEASTPQEASLDAAAPSPDNASEAAPADAEAEVPAADNSATDSEQED